MADAPDFTIRRLLAARVEICHAFHETNAGEYLWPRTPEQLRDLADAECVVEAVDANGEVAGLCYVREDSDVAEQREFGGLFVRDDCRHGGVAFALCVACISGDVIATPPTAATRLIAHVHEENPAPRPLLERLGFVHIGKETFPGAGFPPKMKRNAQGEIVGDLFAFDYSALSLHATFLEGFAGTVGNKSAKIALDVGFYRDDKQATVESLKAIAGGYRADR